MPKPTRPAAYNYHCIGWCYDTIATAYSLGAIDRAKASHLRWVEPGMRVLYVGAGTGKEIQAAATRGATLTCLEPCEAMRRRLVRRLTPWAGQSHVLPTTLEDAHLTPRFDLVVANYFLNLFDARTMPRRLARLADLVEPDGRLVISDFATPHPDTPLRRLMHHAYYRPVNLAGRLLGICALHPIYDYTPLLPGMGLHIQSQERFPLAGAGPAFYQTLCAHKKRGG